jgi:2-polyprenyl-6-hydroxyphenyl methylase/3-demethylubiquinone-9 3-methyltransferase
MLRKDMLDCPALTSPTIDQTEIDRFNAMAEEWWKPDGRFRAMHAFNPVRCDYIINMLSNHFDRDRSEKACLENISILDVGCGAGMVCEPLAKRGATVTGIDATRRNIDIARWHAEKSNLDLSYRHQMAEHLLDEGLNFDVVLSTEVIEHVANPALLMSQCAALLKPGGTVIVGTLNRTVRSFLKAIIGAEYVLRILPRGTHDWRRFLSPQSIQKILSKNGLNVIDVTGLTVNPLTMKWRLSGDTSVNYILQAVKPDITHAAKVTR